MNMHIKENNKFITPNVIFFVAEKYKITLAKIKKNAHIPRDPWQFQLPLPSSDGSSSTLKPQCACFFLVE